MTDISAIAATNNLTTGNTDTLSPADKMFAKFHGKNQAVGARSVAFDFDDVVDMVNPLQHIPVLSSLYRAVTDEEISSVSRIAGDTLYGGVMGLGSACMSMASAAVDEIMSVTTGGTASEIVVSMLSDDKTTQVASSETKEIATTETRLAALQTPIPQPPLPTRKEANVAAAVPDVTGTIPSTTASASEKSYALDRTKQPYGGVMDTALMASAQQNQALALAMTGQNQVLQANRNLRNSRFASAAPAATAAVESAANHVTAMEPQTQAAMQNLLQELQKMKAADAYKNAAMNTPVSGASVDMVN